MVRIGPKKDEGGRKGIENTLWLQSDGRPSLTDEVFGQYVVQDLRESASIERRDLTFHHVSECQGKPVGPGIFVVANALFPELDDPDMRGIMIFSMFYGAEKYDRKFWVRDASDTITVPELEVYGELPEEVIKKFPLDREFAEQAIGYNTRTVYGFLYTKR